MESGDGFDIDIEEITLVLPPIVKALRGASLVVEAADSMSVLAELPLLSAEFSRVGKVIVPQMEQELPIAEQLMREGLEELAAAKFNLGSRGSFLQDTLLDNISSLEEGVRKTQSIGTLMWLVGPSLGFETPQTYLILGQDEDELRSSGGFIGLVWEMTVSEGMLQRLVFMPSPDVDSSYDEPFLPTLAEEDFKVAPEPLGRYLFG